MTVSYVLETVRPPAHAGHYCIHNARVTYGTVVHTFCQCNSPVQPLPGAGKEEQRVEEDQWAAVEATCHARAVGPCSAFTMKAWMTGVNHAPVIRDLCATSHNTPGAG